MRAGLAAAAAALVAASSIIDISGQADVAAGERIYVAQKCSSCHAIAGKGNAKGALDDVGSRLSADDIQLWIVDAKTMTAKAKAARKPEMRNYALSKTDLDALVSYLASLKKR